MTNRLTCLAQHSSDGPKAVPVTPKGFARDGCGGPVVSIREARPGDASAVLAVRNAAAREMGADQYTSEQIEAWTHEEDPPPDWFLEAPDRGDITYIVAESAGAIVGFGTVNHEAGEMLAVYVHPDHSRHGIGTTILATLEAAVRDRGVTTISLEASLNSVPFYEGHGFSSVGSETREMYFGVTLPVERMVKCLAG